MNAAKYRQLRQRAVKRTAVCTRQHRAHEQATGYGDGGGKPPRNRSKLRDRDDGDDGSGPEQLWHVSNTLLWIVWILAEWGLAKLGADVPDSPDGHLQQDADESTEAPAVSMPSYEATAAAPPAMPAFQFDSASAPAAASAVGAASVDDASLPPERRGPDAGTADDTETIRRLLRELFKQQAAHGVRLERLEPDARTQRNSLVDASAAHALADRWRELDDVHVPAKVHLSHMVECSGGASQRLRGAVDAARAGVHAGPRLHSCAQAGEDGGFSVVARTVATGALAASDHTALHTYRNCSSRCAHCCGHCNVSVVAAGHGITCRFYTIATAMQFVCLAIARGMQ